MNTPIEIYTDGSSLGNPGPGGWGVVITSGAETIIRELGGYEADTTNNRMELLAVIEALKYTETIPEKVEVIIHADSAYVLGGVTTWVANWEKNGWKTAKKEQVLNQDLWKELIALVRTSVHTLSWQKVKGHAGHTYNERADGIATTCAREQSTISF